MGILDQIRKDRLEQGKLATDMLAGILDSIPTDGLPVPNRMGMDAAIVKSESEKIFCFSQIAFGWDNETAENVLTAIVDRAASLGSVSVIDPVALIPPDTNTETIKQVILGIANSSERHGIIVGKGHTEITSKVKVITLVVSALGSVKI